MSAHTLARKRHVSITLDVECYEDLNIEDIDWQELLDLQGDETVEVSLRECAPL